MQFDVILEIYKIKLLLFYSYRHHSSIGSVSDLL